MKFNYSCTIADVFHAVFGLNFYPARLLTRLLNGQTVICPLNHGKGEQAEGANARRLVRVGLSGSEGLSGHVVVCLFVRC